MIAQGAVSRGAVRVLFPLLLTLAGAAALAGCRGKESIVSIGGDKKLSAEDIDKDPIALLPGGAVGFGYLDAQAFFASSIGPSGLRLAARIVPLTPEMNFDPKRDIQFVWGGVYSMQGADFAMIVQGTFDQTAIEAAANRGAVTAVGKPLTKIDYAGNTMYVSGEVGLVLLTPKTALLGNSAGLRRGLDRIRDGRVKREIPDWMIDLSKTEGAQVTFGADLASQPAPATMVAQVPFLQGMKTARLIGKFEPPGLKVAGALTYPDAATAQNAEGQIRQMGQLATMANALSFLGIGTPLQSLESRCEEADVQVLALVEGVALGKLLEKVGFAAAQGAFSMGSTPGAAVPAQ
jgi:hypothetical protein